ncbi:MAG: BBE domain-containing protein [Gaiellales bacterium]
MAAATLADLHRVTDSLRAYRDGAYLNFEEESVDPASFYGRETYARLREVKALVDPDELIRSNHPIPPAR